ncbi:MAG: sensor histidine kinase [Micromonosporaceae bacterium]
MNGLIGYWRRLAAWSERTWPPAVVDAVITTVCFLTFAIYGVTDGRLTWWYLSLAVANCLPLMWRRRYPLGVAFVVGVSTTWLALLEAAIPHFPPAQLVATYTFASLSPPGRRMIGVAGTVAGIVISLLVPAEPLGAYGLVGIAFAVAYALGTAARARRDRIAMLEERARRLAEERSAAAARERERIAREMHDIIAHAMSLVIVQAEAGPVAVRRDPERAVQIFDTISQNAREALAQLRRTLGLLRPDAPGADGAPLQPAPDLTGLPVLVDSVRQAGLEASLEEQGTPRALPPDLAATVYRIVQESLTNTLRHAQARRATVRLRWEPEALRLEVRDDGRGPRGDGYRSGAGRGLIGMRERVDAAGGELSCGPGPDGTGFHVVATLPLP